MKRNQKGFTLIELLAVIVILAIIALIATPMVLKYIEESRKGAAESSCYAAIKAAELYYASDILENGSTSLTEVNVKDLDLKNVRDMEGTLVFEPATASDTEVSAKLGAGFLSNGYTCTQDANLIVTCE